VHNRGTLTELIRRGQRRQLCYSGVTALSLATALALSGGILLLLVGTQILNWYWLVLLFAGGLAVSAYRLRKSIFSGYEIAQEVDRRLEFKDALSTAYYFAEPSHHSGSPPEFVEHQRQMAEQLARSADIGRGLPFLKPRTLYINAALAVLACGMFGLRYGLQRSLDLRPPLVRIAFEGFLGSPRDIADAKKGKRPFEGEGNRDKGSATDPQDAKFDDRNNAADSSQEEVDTSDANNPDSGAKDSAKAKAGGQQDKNGNDSQESADKESPSPDGDAAGDSSLSSEAKSKAGKQPDGGKNSNQAGSDGDNSSLADKLRDAISNLLAKLKPQSKPNEGQQRTASQSPGSQPGQKKNQSQDGAPKTENQEQADANSSGESQGEQQQGGTDQPAQGKSQGSSNERPNSPDGKSGIGNQDGDKSAREAAELAAMGKISEIIGKRAQNITGEVMVEVSSGKQQLKTQYSQRNATHVEAGGEINRDEVPLAYQQYVQQYFEEVRKLPASKAKASPEKPTTPGN
jgi:hypothetical protein